VHLLYNLNSWYISLIFYEIEARLLIIYLIVLICKKYYWNFKNPTFQRYFFLCVYKTTGMLFLSLSQCRCIFRGHALLASIFTQPHRIFITILGVEHIGPDHVQLTLFNWDTESVLALNEKLKVNWKFKALSVSQLSKVNCTWSGPIE